MNHKDRIDAVLTGRPIDRPPVSVWGHDFLCEWSAADLAAQTVENQRTYDYDFVKITPRWTLFAEPWGNRYEPPVEQKFPRLVHRIVRSSADLESVPVIDANHPVLAEQVEAIEMIVQEIGDEVDCLATLFSPLAVLGLVAGGVGRPLIGFAQEKPKFVHEALTHITATLTAYAQALLNAGASGVFYAPLQWSSLDVCPGQFYAEFGEPYDRRLLETIADARFNVLHVCGDNNGMPRFYDYPVAVLNWDNFGEGNPGLHEVAEASGKVVAGGIPHQQLHTLDRETLLPLAREALGQLDTGVMLAGGCVIDALTPSSARAAVVSIADEL